MSHIPVLLRETLSFLNPKPGEFVIDGTLGAGGHARALIDRMKPNGIFLGIDWDRESLERAKFELEVNFRASHPHFAFHWASGNFADLPEILKDRKLGKANGLLLDLGFSSDQIEARGRGFSFTRDEPLLMTYAEDAEPVRDILKRIGERELAGIIREFGEERYAARIAKAIVARERTVPIERSGELAGVVASAVPKGYERGRIHPATRTFQALRIYANRELENLARILKHLPDVLLGEGRVAIIAFHSLEDRLVKHEFRALAKVGTVKILTKKPVTASDLEIRDNPRARSAKLRAAVVV
jgi:16S rRNA (cytosine1402-N4)-methyltransferase